MANPPINIPPLPQTTTTTNEDFSHYTPRPPPSTPPSFFSRMSSLGSNAAPILEQVYDRAHKKAVALKETNIREAVKSVSAKAGEVVDKLVVVDSVDDEEDDEDDVLEDDASVVSKEEEDVEVKEAQDAKQLQTQRSPMKAVLGAYTEFRTTGRYNHKRDDSSELPIVGGADQVALNRIKLNNLLTDDNSNNNKEERTYKRSNSYYQEAVKNLLLPGQRALFFGKGTMGVILKPTYLASWRGKDGGGLISPNKRGGVFIDALVPGGHAERSGVVYVGDHVVKIGNVDVSSMTLEELVKVIAEAERPSIMILMAEWEPKVVEISENNKRFVSPLDLVFGYVNWIGGEGVLDGMRSASSSLLDEEEDGEAEEVLFSSESPVKNLGNLMKDCVVNGDVVEGELKIDHTNDEQSSPKEIKPNMDAKVSLTPTQEEFDKLVMYSSQRTNGHEEQDESQSITSKSLTPLPSKLARAAFLNPNFRNTLHEAFKECCNDPRKANFLEHFYSEFRTKKETEAKSKERDNGHKNGDVLEDVNDATTSTNQRKLLDIYLALVKFRDEATVCSTKQLLETARGIAIQFLPDDIDSNLTLPEYVAHLAFGGAEKLQSLKRALNDEDEFFEDAQHDGFYHVREQLGVFLSMQQHFLAFLVSDDCARMRAYLRGTSPFVCVEPSMLLENTAVASNFLMYAILHLICMKEPTDSVDSSDEYGNYIKMDTMVLNQRGGRRVAGAASILACPIFILRTLNGSIQQAAEGLVEDEMMGSNNNLSLYETLARNIHILWENFVSPMCGALALCSLSDETQCALDAIRCLLESILNVSSQTRYYAPIASSSLAKSLTSEEFLSALQNLCDCLIHDYCRMLFPNFRRHIFHEWALTEAALNSPQPAEAPNKLNEYLIQRSFNELPKGYSKKTLRQIDLPRGLSLHLPGSSKQNMPSEEDCESVSECLHHADVAIVFGKQESEDDLPKAASDLSADSTVSQSNIHRHACISLHKSMSSSTNVLTPADIPDTFEEYLGSPPFRDRPFKGMLRKDDNNRMSLDGWEVSLTNAMIPVGKGSSDMLYCVSLALSNMNAPAAQISLSDPEVASLSIEELCHKSNDDGKKQTDPQCKDSSFQSPLFADKSIRKMKVSCELSKFNQELKKQVVSSKADTPKHLIGISLVCRRNVIPVMRQTLSLFYEDVCSVKSNPGASKHVCQPLVDLLSVLSSPLVEENSLVCVLEPYMSYALSPWIHRPLRDQSEDLGNVCGIQVLQSLPPVPLALLFVTALLEQKIVFSSSRRSMLMAASMALTQLMKPLNWTHLHVPHAPVSMIVDLIHYPAPFILGLSTDEKQSATILRALPSDVTLVDLDVGRVMLASEFVNDDVEMDDDTRASSQSALRSQLLILAEFLGGIFGSAIYQESWCSDSPLDIISRQSNRMSQIDAICRFSTIQNICNEFLTELISGLPSCCIWMEECNNSTDTAIVFDEDLFMHIKKCPANSTNQLNLGQFNLFLHAFLRTQSLSTLISAGDKNISLFS